MNSGRIQDLVFWDCIKARIFFFQFQGVIPLIEYKFSTLIQNETWIKPLLTSRWALKIQCHSENELSKVIFDFISWELIAIFFNLKDNNYKLLV
jgi:hypothetical protein